MVIQVIYKFQTNNELSSYENINIFSSFRPLRYQLPRRASKAFETPTFQEFYLQQISPPQARRGARCTA